MPKTVLRDEAHELVESGAGIETAEQLEKFEGLGCNFGQGYYFSKPVTAEATTSQPRVDPRLNGRTDKRTPKDQERSSSRSSA